MEIRIEHLTKRFETSSDSGRGVVTAVDDLTLTAQDGKVTALFGPSGCGKTTVLRLICGLENPDSGRIYFGNKEVTALPPEQRGTGMVFQDYGLYNHMSVRKNIRFPLESLRPRLSREEQEKRVEEAAEMLQISDLLEERPNKLSGGQQQRVAIARAIARRPAVLLLDEPFSGLDEALRSTAREQIRVILQETGTTALLVTHDREDIAFLADRVALMENGRITEIRSVL